MICPHRPACPGCPLADLDYAAQLAHKQARLAAAFAPYPHLPAPPAVIGSAWPEGYRHRVKLPVALGAAGHAALGLYAEDGQRIVDTPECPVLEPGLREALAKVRTWLRGKRGVHSVDLRRSSATGQLQLVLACADGQVPGGRKAFAPLVAALPALTSIAVSKADPDRKRVMGVAPEVVWGKPILDESIGDTRYHLHPGAFFQVDPRQAERLHGLVRAAVGEAATVLDLYSGVGAYALMLAPGRKRVLAVEEVPQAARAAQELAPRNVQVVATRVEDLRVDEPFDVAVLNPARRGSDPAVLARIAGLARRMVYVSCGPETLARDLDALAAFGMRVRSVQPIDLFPQTPEVETVVALERGPALREWRVPGGTARGPWGEEPSGAVGRADRALVLFLGATPAHGEVPGARFKRIATVAGHSLVRLELGGSLVPALIAFAKNGHGVAGREPRTARFFAEKAGLVRPFVHIERAGQAAAPLHGDLVAALTALGAPAAVIARAGGGRSGEAAAP
jgi:23S rRNA (uracil-5-)-methyltransferase RumA